MSELLSSWVLKEELKNMVIEENLRNEINTYININDKKCTGKPGMFSNLFYRSNLHYIIDNINKDGLIDELKKVNNN